MTCNEQDVEVQSSCYYFDVCEKNKVDMLRKLVSMDKENAVDFNQVIAMKDRIVRAVKDQRTDVFFIKQYQLGIDKPSSQH